MSETSDRPVLCDGNGECFRDSARADGLETVLKELIEWLNYRKANSVEAQRTLLEIARLVKKTRVKA